MDMSFDKPDPFRDPRSDLRTAPMSRHQLVAVAVTVALCALDGWDVLAITFAAPGIAAQWGLNKAALAVVFSSGLVGIAAGSFLIAPLADVIGRRPTVLLSLAVMAVGTFWTAAAPNLFVLEALRLLTGLGIGAMIAVINALAAEYASERRRDLAVSLVNVGYPIGGVLGGSLAAALLPAFGWRSIFVCVGAACVAMLAVVWRALPEPPGYLIARPKPQSLAGVNRYLARCGQPPVAVLPAPPSSARTPIAALFGTGTLGVTLLVTALYLLTVVPVFYMQNWLPKLVTELGFSDAEAAGVSVWLSIGGIAGGLFVGLASSRLGLKSTVVAILLAMAVTINLFGKAPADLAALRVAAAAAGFSVFGAMVGVYAVVSRSFPTAIRASGTGLVIGIGRLGSIASPLLASTMFSFGLDRAGVSAAMSIPAGLAAILLFFLVGGAPVPLATGSRYLEDGR